MKLLNKIDKINEDITLLQEDIDKLLIEQSPNPYINIIARFLARKKIKDIISPDKKKDKEEIAKDVDDWVNSDKKDKDVNDIVDDVKEKLGVEKKGEEEVRKMIEDIIAKQEKLVNDLKKDPDFNRIKIKFSQPIEFDVRKGKGKGKKLKLEGNKFFDIYEIKEKGDKSTIYFNYETKKQNWLRSYNVLFTATIKKPQSNKDYGSVTIKIVYIDDSALRSGEIKIIDEKILTHRANITIKSLS